MILLVLFPYMSWMMAEAMQLSGIVSILFCGIIMAHYTTHNLSPETEEFSRRFFKTMAFGCESFVFIYMGLATFTYEQDWEHWPIIVVAIIAMLISRLFNVYPNSFLINM
jgi:NhaP-type Na+/H+ or K+/H+ antiporter